MTISESTVEVVRDSSKEKSPTSVKDVKEIILTSSKSIIGKVLSPNKDKLNQNSQKVEVKKAPLMTRREWCDPFGSDDEEENAAPVKEDCNTIKSVEVNGVEGASPTSEKLPELPKPNPVRYLHR